MLSSTLKRVLRKKNLKKISSFYIKFISYNNFIVYEKKFISLFYLYSPKRQHSFFLCKNDNLSKTYSCGQIMAINGLNQKFLKKTTKINSTVILYLQVIYGFLIKKPSCFFIKNFTLRHWIFFQKYLSLVRPSFNFLIIKYSYNINKQPCRRIKRRVLIKLKKSSVV